MHPSHVVQVYFALRAADYPYRSIKARRGGRRPHAHAHCLSVIISQWQYKRRLLAGLKPHYARA